MAVGEQFSLSWNEFHKNLSSGFHSLFEDSSLVDVTLAAEGRKIQAHRVVLSVCSPYFKEMFSGNPCQHPIVFLKDVSFLALKNLLQFMYQGEVNVRQEDLPDFIKTAEQLQVKGLTGGSTKDPTENASSNSTTSQSSTWSNSRNVNRAKSTPSPVPSQLIRKQSSIASKRLKSSPSTALHPAKRPYVDITESNATQEPEEVNLPSGDMIATLKLEPEESYVISSDDPLPDDSKLNDSDFPSDAVLQELEDEPQAGTSMMMGDSKDAVTQGVGASLQWQSATDGATERHFLQQIPRKDNGRMVRKRCIGCYRGIKQGMNTQSATKWAKQVATQCCVCRKAFCLMCFQKYHQNDDTAS